MPKGYMRCQFVSGSEECDIWYPADDGGKYCKGHADMLKAANNGNAANIPVHIPRTVSVIPTDQLNYLNDKKNELITLGINGLVDHIKNIEAEIKNLERDRRAANMAKRELEEKLTEAERNALRLDKTDYKLPPREPKKVKSNEEKAKGKVGFKQWAALFGMDTEKLMMMDDDELNERIAKYKSQHQNRIQ